MVINFWIKCFTDTPNGEQTCTVITGTQCCLNPPPSRVLDASKLYQVVLSSDIFFPHESVPEKTHKQALIRMNFHRLSNSPRKLTNKQTNSGTWGRIIFWAASKSYKSPLYWVTNPLSLRHRSGWNIHWCWNNTLCSSQLWQTAGLDESPNACLLRRKL